MHTTSIQEELKLIEKERARLADKEKELNEKLKAQAEAEKQLQSLFEQSGYPTPRALVIALMKKYGVRVTGSATEGRRKRTTITAQIRDDVKGAVNGGSSKNQASKQFEISYFVINKIIDGKYDHL
jgi:hypothetical protein|tara:strand:+ start:1193 stop:1570 length:378 start_codon:yes stop_codon:yes gene_type:complete